MATTVYIVKRYLKRKKRNGQREHTYALRWQNAVGKWQYEKTGTADKTQADALQKIKWNELNVLGPEPEPEPEPIKPTWQECRDAIHRAMEADNLRSRYIEDAEQRFTTLQAMFPELASPADFTPAMANEYKRRRAEVTGSSWTVKGDLATIRAVFGKWLVRECGLLRSNPFANVSAPKCDEPDVRLVSVAESDALFTWMAERWNNWKLPAIYLEVAALLGWRATEIASIREEDLLPDGFVRVISQTSKTRRIKHGWLPPDLYDELKGCSAGGYAFGRFSDELRRLLTLWKRMPHHAARVQDFAPERLVGWMQDELQRFHDDRQETENKAAEEEGRKSTQLDTFTLHDFRRTAISGMQMAGVTEKEASVMVGATPEVIRRHYEKLDQMAIAKRSVQRRLASDGAASPPNLARRLRATEKGPLDDGRNSTQTYTA